MTESKKCFKCGEEKQITEFYAHKAMADGHLNKCKQCTKNDSYLRRHVLNRDSVLLYDRERAKTPKRREHIKNTVSRWSNEHPERKKAQSKLNNAVRSGRLEKQPCFICGEKAEAHHPDYSLPLDVVWLCPSHHKQTHALVRH